MGIQGVEGDQEAANERVRRVDTADAHVHLVPVGECHGDRAADVDVLARRLCGVHDGGVGGGGDARGGARGHAEGQDPPDVAGVEAGDTGRDVADQNIGAPDLGDVGELRVLAQRGGDLRAEAAAPLVEHYQLGTDRAIDRLVDARLQGGGDDRHRRDQGEADHQRSRGQRGAARVATGVLPGQPAGRTPQPGRPPQDSGHRADQDGREQGRSQEDGQHRQPQHLEVGAGGGTRCEKALQESRRPAKEEHEARADPGPRQPLDLGLSLAQGGHGGDPGSPPRRRHRGDHGDDGADEERHDQGVELDAQLGGRAEDVDQHIGDHDADEEADQGGEDAGQSRLGDDLGEDLAPGGTQGAQQGQLLGTLGHQDAEGVGDQEASDEDGDEGEHQQRGADEQVDLGDRVLLGLRGRLRPGLDLDRGPAQGGGHPVAELEVGDPGLGADIDDIEGAVGLEKALSGGQSEEGKALAGDAVLAAEGGDAADHEGLGGGGLEAHLDLLADHQVAVGCGAGVDDHVVGGSGSGPGGELKGGELGVGDPVESEQRPLVGAADHLPVAEQGDPRAFDRAHGIRHPGHLPHLGEDGLGKRQRRARKAAGRGGRCRALHLDGNTLVDVAQHALEGVPDGVGEDQGAGDEGDAQDDGDRGQDEPQLVAEEAAQADLEHQIAAPGAGTGVIRPGGARPPGPSPWWGTASPAPRGRQPGRPPGRCGRRRRHRG